MQRSRHSINNLNLVIITFLYCFSFIFNDFGLGISAYAIILGILSVLISFLKIIIERSVRMSKLTFPLLIMLLIIAITSLHNFNVEDNTKIYYLFICVVSFVTFFTSEFDEETAKTVSRIILCTGLLFSTLIYLFKISPDTYRALFYGFMTQSAVSDSEFLTSQGYAVAVNGDIAYTLTMILFAAFIALFYKDKKHFILFAYLIVSVLISQRRTEAIFGVLAILISLVILNPEAFRNLIKNHATIFLFIGIGLVIFIGYFVYFYITVPARFRSDNRILMTIYDAKYGIDSSNGRSIIYKIALSLLSSTKNLFLGLGWMNFSKYGYLSGISMVRNVHNIYLQLFLECGLFLGLLFILCLFWLLTEFVRFRNCTSYSMIGLTVLVYVLLAGLTENTIYYPYFWIIIWIATYFTGITKPDLYANHLDV